jgi:ATP-dependent Clp protease protease subunit
MMDKNLDDLFRLQEEEEEQIENRKPESNLIEKILKTRNILLSGEINKSLGERIIRQLILLEDQGDDPIKVFIDSPGGDADAGFAIFDMMRFIKPEVVVIGMGLVASAAAIILLAAPKELDKLRRKINKLISKETGQKIDKVEKDTDRDYWMNAEEALEYGLISKIISNRDEL